MTNLSPAAFAVVDAFVCANARKTDPSSNADIAAALRAVADQVTPWRPEPTEDSVGPTFVGIDYGYAWALFSKTNDIRQELIAIANELEAQ